LLAPWSRDFSFRETLSTLDVLVFSVAPSFAFCVYVLWLVDKFGAESLTVLLIVMMVYSLLGVATFALGITLAKAPGAWRLLPYAFAYGIYCVYVLHPVRLCAYVGELTFDRSYRSPFVPKKVLDQIGRF
jgi:hypothetical protein